MQRDGGPQVVRRQGLVVEAVELEAIGAESSAELAQKRFLVENLNAEDVAGHTNGAEQIFYHPTSAVGAPRQTPFGIVPKGTQLDKVDAGGIGFDPIFEHGQEAGGHRHAVVVPVASIHQTDRRPGGEFDEG